MRKLIKNLNRKTNVFINLCLISCWDSSWMALLENSCSLFVLKFKTKFMWGSLVLMCCCVSGIYQPMLLTSSFAPSLKGAISGFGRDLVRAAAPGCGPNWCRRMKNTQTLSQARLCNEATVSFGQATAQSPGQPLHVYVYHHISQHFIRKQNWKKT